MEYKFIYHSRVQQTADDKYHENAFRIGYAGYTSNGADGAGSRYPSMWIYYDPGADGAPHCKFSLSNAKNPYAQFKALYPIESEQIYFVVIEFNQSWNTITVTNDSSTVVLVDGQRTAGTADEFIDSNMSVWISQFGYNGVNGDGPNGAELTAAANLTMWDIRISTWNHDHSPSAPPTVTPTAMPSHSPSSIPTMAPTAIPTVSPTIDPTANRSSESPTIQPIEWVESAEGIELYEFYNESNSAYRGEMAMYRRYSQWVHEAVIWTLQNVTGHSMDIHDGDGYYGQQWHFGGVSQWIGCMVFNERLNDSLVGCPSIPQPQNEQFQFVAVEQLWVEADGNVDGFRGFIVGRH